MVTSKTRRGLLIYAASVADAQGVSLRYYFTQAIVSAFGSVPAGGAIISSSGNGRSVQFVAPDVLKSLTPDEQRDEAVYLRDAYFAVLRSLGVTPPDISDRTQDATITDQMLASEWFPADPITEFQNDYTSLRFAYSR